MVEIFENEQSLIDQGMAAHTFDVRNETHPAGVVFLIRVVQTRLTRLGACMLDTVGIRRCEGSDVGIGVRTGHDGRNGIHCISLAMARRHLWQVCTMTKAHCSAAQYARQRQ
jgi:hypothetical protein